MTNHTTQSFQLEFSFTKEPFFPPNLENYAPWVAQHGLLYPYGECQCGCGLKTKIASNHRVGRGWLKEHPVRFIPKHQRRKAIVEIFQQYVIPGEPDACWEWQGYRDKLGYGELKHWTGKCFAHRFSYEYYKGPIPNGLCILHRCDNPSCINPKHLLIGTQQDNMADMVNKGRQARGSRRGGSKLTEAVIPEIRALRATGMFYTEIAQLYGVTDSTIRSIIHGSTWSHVP